jgi:hypothetical protein
MISNATTPTRTVNGPPLRSAQRNAHKNRSAELIQRNALAGDVETTAHFTRTRRAVVIKAAENYVVNVSMRSVSQSEKYKTFARGT